MDEIQQGITRAREKGIDDGQILDSLTIGDAGKDYGDGIQAARKKGIEDKAIVESIMKGREQIKSDKLSNQSWTEWAGDIGRGVVHGLGSQIANLGSTLQAPADAPAAEQSAPLAKGAEKAMEVGQGLQQMARGDGSYEPGGAEFLRPSTWPKAIAEAAPSIIGYLAAARAGAAVGGTAGLLGGPLAEITAPAGALIGGLGGMGLYAYGQNRGQNATAHAQEADRRFPEQKDFDQTLGPTLLQSGVDAVTQAAGGLVGRAAGPMLANGADRLITGVAGNGVAGKIATTVLNGPQAISGVGLKGMLSTGSRVLTTDGALATQAAADSAIQDYAATKDSEGGPQISQAKALEAAREAAVLGTALRAGRLAGNVHGSTKFNTGDPEAVTRVVDHMRSEAFPADPSNHKKTSETLSLAKSYFGDRVNKLKDIGTKSDNFDPANPDKIPAGLTPKEQEAIDTAHLFLKKGAVLEPKQMEALKNAFVERDGQSLEQSGEIKGSRQKLFDAMRDMNAVNVLAEKAGETTEHSKVSLGSAIKLAKHPFSLGSLGTLAGEAALHGAGHVGLASLGPAAGVGVGAYLAAKGLGKLTGISANNEHPLQRMADRYASSPEGRALAPVESIGTQRNNLELVQQALAMAKARGAAQAAPVAPVEPVSPVAGPTPARTPGPAPHESLNAALGLPEDAVARAGANRFTSNLPPEQARPRQSAPAEQVGANPVMDMHAEIAAQAKAEGQPLADVYGQHVRSAFSIANNPNIPAPVRARAAAEAAELRAKLTELKQTLSEEEGRRAESPRIQDTGPAPGYAPILDLAGFSPQGQAYLRQASPQVQQALTQAQSPQQVAGTLAQFASGFPTAADQALAAKKIQSGQIQKAVSEATKARAHAKTGGKVKSGRGRGRPKGSKNKK